MRAIEPAPDAGSEHGGRALASRSRAKRRAHELCAEIEVMRAHACVIDARERGMVPAMVETLARACRSVRSVAHSTACPAVPILMRWKHPGTKVKEVYVEGRS